MDFRYIIFYMGGKFAAFVLAMFLYCAYETRKEKKKNEKDSGKKD